MQYRPSTPLPMYYHEGQRPRRGRPPATHPASRRQAAQQHADMRAVHSYPYQLDYRNTTRYQQQVEERMYAQHMEATMAAHRAYQQLADMRAVHAVQPPRAHQAAITQTRASRQQLQERPNHDENPPMAHQASTLQKMTYQQLEDTGRMHTTHPKHNNHVPASQMEATYQHMQIERMQACQMSNSQRQNVTQRNLHAADPVIPLPDPHTFSSQVDYQRHELTHNHHTPYSTLPQHALATQATERVRRNQRIDPHPNKRTKVKTAKMPAPVVPNVYQPHAGQPVSPQTICGKKGSEQRPDQRHWPLYATHPNIHPQEDVLNSAHVMYQPSPDTFAAAHVAYQPNTHMYTTSEIIYQPRTNTLAAKQLVYQPGTDMIATAEAVYQPETNMMSTRQTMIQPQEDMIRTKEALYQPHENILATRETNIQYRKNLVNTTETIYQPRPDVNMDNHTNSSQSARKHQKQTETSEKTVQETQKIAPILRQILSVEQKQDESRTSSHLTNGNKGTSEQKHLQNDSEVQLKTPTRQRKSSTPKKTLRLARKRKLSTDSECTSSSQALVPTQQSSLTESEWLARLEFLALSRTKSPEQPTTKRPVGRPRTIRSTQSPGAPQLKLDNSNTEERPPNRSPLVVANYQELQSSAPNFQVNNYSNIFYKCSTT